MESILSTTKENGKILSEDDEIKLISEFVTKSYEEKIDFIKKKFVKLIVCFSLFSSFLEKKIIN